MRREREREREQERTLAMTSKPTTIGRTNPKIDRDSFRDWDRIKRDEGVVFNFPTNLTGGDIRIAGKFDKRDLKGVDDDPTEFGPMTTITAHPKTFE
jgi:hypothetical protein